MGRGGEPWDVAGNGDDEVLEVDVAIAGGGLGGLALAVGLQERGIDAHVFEKAVALRTDSATAVSMALNGIRALEGIKPGLAQQIMDLGLDSHVKHILRIPGKGEIVTPIDHKPGEFVMVGWKFCQDLFAGLLEEKNIHCNHRFVRYQPTEDGQAVDAEFMVREGDQEQTRKRVVRAKMLVGADGLWSAMRKQMIGDEPRYMNFVNWNALVYNPGGKVFKHTAGEVHMLHHANEVVVGYISDLGHGYVLWLLRILDTDGSLAKDYLQRAGASINKQLSKERALEQLKGLQGWDDLRGAIEATEAELIYERRSMDRAPLSKWSDCEGHAVLIGDAAHGMYSALGMGARTAFEDAHQLAVALEGGFTAPDPSSAIPVAIRSFEESRVPRISRIHEFATELTEQECFMPDWVHKLSREERAQRFNEFLIWTCRYPDCPFGDPSTTYWK